MDILVAKAADGESARRKTIAASYLRMTRLQLEDARRNREQYAKLGRVYGLTNQAIGDLLGITEARVRQIVAGD